MKYLSYMKAFSFRCMWYGVIMIGYIAYWSSIPVIFIYVFTLISLRVDSEGNYQSFDLVAKAHYFFCENLDLSIVCETSFYFALLFHLSAVLLAPLCIQLSSNGSIWWILSYMTISFHNININLLVISQPRWGITSIRMKTVTPFSCYTRNSRKICSFFQQFAKQFQHFLKGKKYIENVFNFH